MLKISLDVLVRSFLGFARGCFLSGGYRWLWLGVDLVLLRFLRFGMIVNVFGPTERPLQGLFAHVFDFANLSACR